MKPSKNAGGQPHVPAQATIRGLCSSAVFKRAEAYVRAGCVILSWRQGDVVGCRCQGSEIDPYFVRATLGIGRPTAARCDCPYEDDDFCKHLVAMLISYSEVPNTFIDRPEPVSALLERPPAEIEATLRAFVLESPSFEEWLSTRLLIAPLNASQHFDAAEAAAFKRGLKSLIRGPGRAGRGDAYWYPGNITGSLQELMDKAVAHAHGGDGRNGLEQLVLLAEASADAFAVMDDSDGDLGDFVFELGEELAAARGNAGTLRKRPQVAREAPRTPRRRGRELWCGRWLRRCGPCPPLRHPRCRG